jgi:hypothetical protein
VSYLEESEKEFQSWVIGCGRAQGWLIYHTFSSKSSEPGFPDLVCVKGSSSFYAELKRERGKVSSAQSMWLLSLERAGQETHIWRPSDREEIFDRFARRQQ